ncbi:MAG: OmpH family outer membrane protein [Gemmatimonadales bacterium]|jgi:Skp family chaperone for outer membrane proteins|nr:OmpH family outer membrane protein [Gemmatimonadales bacterium]
MKLERRTITRLGLVAAGVLSVVGVAALPSAPVQDGPKLAIVASEIVLRQTPGYAQAESTFSADLASWRLEVEALQRQLDSAATAFDQQSVVLSPTARQTKTDELRGLQQQYQTRATELQQRAEQRRQELVGPLEERIQTVIDGLRAERNLTLVFDVSAPGNNIVSADPVIDLTTTVVRRLNPGGQ